MNWKSTLLQVWRAKYFALSIFILDWPVAHICILAFLHLDRFSPHDSVFRVNVRVIVVQFLERCERRSHMQSSESFHMISFSLLLCESPIRCSLWPPLKLVHFCLVLPPENTASHWFQFQTVPTEGFCLHRSVNRWWQMAISHCFKPHTVADLFFFACLDHVQNLWWSAW